MLRGKIEALRAFEPLRAEQYEVPATKAYVAAFAKLEANDPAPSRPSLPMSARAAGLAGELPSQAVVEWRNRHTDRDGLIVGDFGSSTRAMTSLPPREKTMSICADPPTVPW